MRRGMSRACSLAGVGIMTVAAATLWVSPAQAGDVAHNEVVSDVPVKWTPHLVPDASYARPVAYSISQAGSQMVVGGDFATVENGARTTQYSRTNVFAFDSTTGVVSDFAPVLNGTVRTVLGAGDDVYVGGNFTSVNGEPSARLVKLDLATGEIDPTFRAGVKGSVTDLELVHGQLIVSGTFSQKLASLSPTTGRPTSYLDTAITGPLPHTSQAKVFRFDVSPDGTKLVAVGNFTQIDGVKHWRVFMMDLTPTSSSPSSWYYEPAERACHAQTITNYQEYVKDVDFAPDSSYFVLASTGGHRINGEGPGQVLCDSAARFEVDDLTPTKPFWINYTGGDTLHSVAVTGVAVYVQGHSRWLDNPYGVDNAGPGAVSRPGGGAIDAETGKALPWNPEMPQRKGGYQILPTAEGVWFVTDGMRFNGRYRYGIRFVPLP